ncbi:hypothetical protein NA876_17615 [Escherichia coli]|nr:hypothetical protein [Escherichia coli]
MRSSIKVRGGKKVVIKNNISLSQHAFLMASDIDLLEVSDSVSYSKGTPFHIDSCAVFNAHGNLDLGGQDFKTRYITHGEAKKKFYLSKVCIYLQELIYGQQ